MNEEMVLVPKSKLVEWRECFNNHEYLYHRAKEVDGYVQLADHVYDIPDYDYSGVITHGDDDPERLMNSHANSLRMEAAAAALRFMVGDGD